MARIKTISEDQARGIRRAFLWQAKRQCGYLPGIFKILMTDLALARHSGAIYNHLHLRKPSTKRLLSPHSSTTFEGQPWRYRSGTDPRPSV